NMKKTIRDLLLVENTQLNKDNFRLVLESSEPLPVIKAGQFVNVEVSQSTDTFLRRPFSVLNVDNVNNQISLLIKILGRASKVLTTYKVGETVSIIFPLGNGFTTPNTTDNILLIGGGSGVAPMFNIAKTCGLPKTQIHILLGARSVDDHIDASDFEQYANIYKASEDGTIGEKGFVTNHSIYSDLSKFNKVYTCGPEPMMIAIAADTSKAGIFCEVSLENMMACGFGVCLCCVEKTKKGNQCVCTEGPVFNVNELSW
ncbi:MAG: dihydroorotate dehydrogenase electron transfer subunit, partial [Draconibacterium sp.]